MQFRVCCLFGCFGFAWATGTWVAPKATTYKASHPMFPHVQSIEDAEHADQARARCKTQEKTAKTLPNIGERKLNPNFFSQTFRAPPGYPGKKKFDFPGFEGHTELFGPHPFVWKTPTPPEISGLKSLGLGSFFVQKGLEVCYCPWGCHPDPRLGPVLGPSRSHPGSEGVPSRFAMCFVFHHFGPIQVPRWGPSRPVLVPSCSRAFLPGSGLDGLKQTSRPLRIRA